MKEATGELSGTVITVVAIAAVAAIFTAFILPSIKRSIRLTTACQAAGLGTYDEVLDDSEIHCKEGTCTLTVDSKTSSKVCDVEDVD